MTGTPSRTATAHDDGKARRSEPEKGTPRGCVGRKLQAKLRSEEHEQHMRLPMVGRGRVMGQNPKVIRIPRWYMWRIYGAKVTRLTPGDLSVCSTQSKREERLWE